MQTKSHFICCLLIFKKLFMCLYFLNISSTFEQYRDNTDNHDNFGQYNRDKKFSYHYIPTSERLCLSKTSLL